MSAEFSLKISKKYPQIVSSEDCAKHCFKNEDTLVIVLARIELSIAFMKSRIGSISKEIGLISITHEILNMSHFVIYSYKILFINFCAHFDAIIVVFIKVPCWGMAYQITTIFWSLDDTKKRRIFESLLDIYILFYPLYYPKRSSLVLYPPISLHLIFAILQFEISSLMNWIFLPAVACKIQVHQTGYFKLENCKIKCR